MQITNKLNFYNSNFLKKTNIPSTARQKIKKIFWVSIGILTSYYLVDSGLAHLLVLETLRHGTGPLGYIGISLFGADPNYGGSFTGSSAGIYSIKSMKNSKNFFHVFKDSEFPFPPFNKILPKVHSTLSGIASVRSNEDNAVIYIAKSVFGAIFGFLTPTLKFRFAPSDILNCTKSCIFENDPDYGKKAYRTSQFISSTHLGITGSLTQGLDETTLTRILNDPIQALFGLTVFVLGIIVARASYLYFKDDSTDDRSAIEATPHAKYWPDCTKKIQQFVQNNFSKKELAFYLLLLNVT